MIEPIGIIEWSELILSWIIFFVFGIACSQIITYFKDKEVKDGFRGNIK